MLGACVQRGAPREILAVCLEERIWGRAGLWTREWGGLIERWVGGSEGGLSMGGHQTHLGSDVGCTVCMDVASLDGALRL